MHSLFVRIFVLFWIAMALIVGGSIAVTFAVAAREYESPELQRRPNIAIQASEILGRGGYAALHAWLETTKNGVGDRELYIIGPDGKDILGRRLSDGAARRLALFGHGAPGAEAQGGEPTGGEPAGGEPPGAAARDGQPPRSPGPPPGNFRPPHFAPQIVGPDGATYSVLLVPRRPSIFGALTLPGISLTILAIALAVSALASWWLAEHLSAPIRRIQAGARALAQEKFDPRAGGARVSAGLEARRDELAVLARDFDAMADQLRANRAAITRLLRDISHELRSPLARMRVAVGLARQPGADAVRQMERLEREIERLDVLISQVLKLARLHGADAAFERAEFDLDELLEDVVRDANFEGAVKGCRVVQIQPAHASLTGNRNLVSSAVENVLRNAVRYSPAGGLVEVGVESVPPDGLTLVIRDRGPGVPPDDLERIFEPFYRVAESRDRDSGGEGIGLAITAQVMKAHGGGASAVNRAEGGLEVKLHLTRAA